MIQNDHFIIKTKVYFNKGSMQMLRCMKGHCALVVSDGIMQELGYLKMAQGYLKDVESIRRSLLALSPIRM